jgi:hypothetical protein
MATRLMAAMGSRSNNYFDRARGGAAAVLLAAGGAAILGATLDWVTIQPPIVFPEKQAHLVEPFTGIDVGDGKVVVVAGAVLVISALLLTWRKKPMYSWIAFLASMVIGAIAVADFRGLSQLFYDEMDRIGRPSPGFGLWLVATSALVGMFAAIAGSAATPAEEDQRST